ncbi:MFS family permease [Povalibacter uvarum]|uniref:MFS family permease n=1 Tax=Povalibacter uvarum TaxID=732238 RepID=A0A841HU45_9GAMM|nr:MFS transporter [Povalibacter uvarum]MBB6096323.1 MFS family permease [Povalibacter uvarum]
MALPVRNAALENDAEVSVSRRYAWIVFAVTFGLLLSDYMSRQVLNAVFPHLKAEWALSDAQLGTLSGIVSLAVGLLALPLSLLADRWGRIRSLVLMAALWSVATLGCAIAQDFQHMLIARLLVGVGEAAYGSVGLAVVLTVFPARLRATITGMFLAGSMIGSVLGISIGGLLAQQFGWRSAFTGMAVFGGLLTICYPLIVRERRIASSPQQSTTAPRPKLSDVVGSCSVIYTYLGSGVQVFVSGALLAWLPSHLNRAYHMPVAQGALVAAVFVLASATGMALCGNLSDRIGRDSPTTKFGLAIAYCLTCFLVLTIAFQLPPGLPQLVLIGLGMFVGAGTVGPSGAMVANLTPAPIHGTAFATLSLANNLLGLAPGPIVVGALADVYGLTTALQLVPLVCLASALLFARAARCCRTDLRHSEMRADLA